MKWLSYPLLSCFVLWHFIPPLLYKQTDNVIIVLESFKILESFTVFSLLFWNPIYIYNNDKSVRSAQDGRKKYEVTSEQSVHAELYTVKKHPQMLPKYAELTGMLYGALSEQTKRVQSASLSPVLPHPHIISRKIPDICRNFFAGTGKALISRCCYTPSIGLFCCSGLLPRRHQQSIQTEVKVRAHHCLWMTIGESRTGNTK